MSPRAGIGGDHESIDFGRAKWRWWFHDMGGQTSDRCPGCDRERCEWWTFVPGKPPTDTVNRDSKGCALPENCRYQNAYDEHCRHLVDWRARARVAEAELARRMLDAEGG